MIHSFSCKNFYSFGDLTTISFVVNNKAPYNNGYLISPSDNRLSKVEIVIGPNASGKTNLLKILPFFKWLITIPYNSNLAVSLPIKPFMFGEKKNQPIELSVDFEIDGDIYIYSFVLNETRIISEDLKVKNKTNQKTTSKKLFSRLWNDKSGKYELDDKNFNLPKGFETFKKANVSIVSAAAGFEHQESVKIVDYWQKIETNVIEAGWIGDRLLPNASQHLIEVLDFYSEEKNKKIKEKAEKILSRFELGLDTFDIKKEKKENALSINVRVGHSFGGQKEYLPMQYESSGTKQLFVLLKTILLVLASGSIAVLDEFDVNLHPEMVMALFELFISPETNPNKAQLLFSSHSHLVLNKLDKYQIILSEKNEKGVSEAWRLDEVDGVRSDDNYYGKYIAGAYGAIPNL